MILITILKDLPDSGKEKCFVSIQIEIIQHVIYNFIYIYIYIYIYILIKNKILHIGGLYDA